MESEPSPTDAVSDEISNEKLIDGEAISHVKETEKPAAAEANLDVESRDTSAEGNSNGRSDSVVLPITIVQEENKSHQEPEFSVSSEERATVDSESEKQQDCTSTPEFSPEPTENKEHVQVEETDSEAKNDQVVPELVYESKGIHGEALDSSTVPGSISETEGYVEEPISAYASAEPAPKETGNVSQDEHIMVKSSSLEVDLNEVDVDTGLLQPPTDVNLVETTETNKEPETKITDVEEPVVVTVNEDNFATEIVEVTTKVENAIEDLESDKVEDQSLEIKTENSLETINPLKAVASAIEIEQNRDMEAMITDEKQKVTLEAEGVVNLAIEAATHTPEIPSFVIPAQSISGSTLETGPDEETEEKEIEDKTDAVVEVQKQFPSESTKPEDGKDEAPKEVATSAIISTEETSDVEAKIAKQFLDDSINDNSSIGVDEKIKQLGDEFAEDAQEKATEIKRELPTDFLVATSAIMNAVESAEVGVKVEDDEQEGVTNVANQFPRDSSSAISTVDVEETREVDAKAEKQFADDSTNATSAIRVDEETKDLEIELADDTQEATELQTNSRSGTSAIITAEEGAELGANIEDEKQEALTKVGNEFPSESSCATLVVEAEETREPGVKFAQSKQEMEEVVDKEAPSEFTSATLTTLAAEETTETEATAADDKQTGATEVEKQSPIDSCSATPAIGTDEEARQSEAKLADGIQEVAIEVEKLVSAESVDVHSAIVTADKAKDVEDKIKDGKQEEYTNVEQQIPRESSNAVSAIGTNEETRKQEGNLEHSNQEAATELEKELPTESIAANSTIVRAEEDREVGSLSGTEVETPIPSESGSATLAIGTDEEIREPEVRFADDKNEVATAIEKQISTDSNGAAPDIVVTQFLDGKAKDDKQEVAEEAEEPVPSNSGTSILATGTADEIRGPETEFADENQGANGAEMQVPTEFSGSTSTFPIVEETTEIEDDKQGAETEVQKQVPSDSITSLPAARTYEGTREPEVPIADDKQEEVTEDEKIVPVPTVLSGIDTIIINEETRELEAIIEDDKQAEKEVDNHVLSESSKDNSDIVKTEKIREIETKLDDDKQDAEIVGVEQTHGDSSIATLVATDEQEALAEVKNEVPTDSCGSNSSIATSKELTETEVSIIDGYQEAAKEVEKQVPSDSITASSAIGTNEETSESDVKLADDAKEVEAVAKHVPTESIGDSTSIVSAEKNSETQAQTEDVKQEAGRKLEHVPEIDEETKKLEVKLEDCKQPTDFEEVPTESSGDALAIAPAMETKELEAKIEDDNRELVEKQVQSESTSGISAIGTVEEARELQGKVADGKEEGKTVTEKQVLIQENEADATSEIAQVFIDKEKDILLVGMIDGKDNSSDNLEIHKDIGNQVKEDAIDINVPEPPTDPKTHETSNGTSVILCGDDTRQSKVEALNEKQDIPVEIKEPSADETNKIGSNAADVAAGAAKETTETESKVVERKQEAEVDIVQQVPSDSIVETSAIETAEETRKLEAEILEDKQREATVADKQVVNRANEIDASSEIIEASIKEENDIVIVEMVDGGHMKTTKLAKEDASYIGMPEVVTNVRANQSPIAISIIPTSHEQFTQPKFEVIDEMQERALEIEPPVTEINRSDSASVSAEVPLEEETSHVGIENIADKKGEILDAKTSTETSGDINVAAKISEIAFEGVKGPKDDEMVRKNNEFSQITETEVHNENSKVDTIIIVEASKNLDNGTQIDDASLEGNRSSEGGELVKDEQKEGNIDSPGITEVSTELGKTPDVAKEIEETNDGNIESGSQSLSMTSKAYDIGCGVSEVQKIGIEFSNNESKNLQSKTMALYETTKLDDENTEISNILSEENKVSEGPEVVQDDTKEEKDYKASITGESKDDNTESKGCYIEIPKDLDVKEVIATTSGVTELLDVENNKGSGKEEIEKPKDENLVLAPKSADVSKVKESPKQEISAKTSPRRSNNIISKVKHSIVKAKKAIMGKSQAPKDASPRSKEIK